MLKFQTFYIVLIICLSIGSPLLRAQFTWKLNTEGGYFTSEGSALNNKDDILLQLDGNLRYLYRFKNKMISFDLRLRPEIYGYQHPFKVIKFRGEGSYFQKGNKFEWGFDFVNYRYKYSGESLEQNYNTLLVQTHLQWFWGSSRFLHCSAAYVFQKIYFQGDLDLDLTFLEGLEYFIPNKYMRYGLGAYLERFVIRHNKDFNNDSEKNFNSGWRLGPAISFNYLKDFFLKVDYRFLLHFSRVTHYPSYEQRIRMVAGVLFLNRWSLFLSVDYYMRHLSRNPADMDKFSIFYTPINIENRIFLKLSYDLAMNIEVYVKYGYFNENLVYYEQDLAGLTGVIGFEIRK